MKIFFYLYVASTLFIFSSTIKAASSHSQESFADAIDEIRPMVGRVDVQFNDGTSSSGTGFFVNLKGHFVTANHVIAVPAGKSIKEVQIYCSLPTERNNHGLLIAANLVGSPASVIAVDAEHDIAVLLPRDNPFEHAWGGVTIGGKRLHVPVRAANFSTKPVRDGDEIFVSGFPLSSYVLTTNPGKIAAAYLPSYGEHTKPTDSVYVAALSVNPGNSGGPVFSSITHSVIGICQAYQQSPIKSTLPSHEQAYGLTRSTTGTYDATPIGENSGNAIIVPSSYVVDLLKSSKIEFSTDLAPRARLNKVRSVRGTQAAPGQPSTHRP